MLPQGPKFFQRVNRSIGACAIAELGGDVDIKCKRPALQVVVVDLIREAPDFIYPSDPIVSRHNGLDWCRAQEWQNGELHKRNFVAKTPGQIDTIIMAFRAVFAVPHIGVCSRKAAEKLAPRSLIGWFDHGHGFLEERQRIRQAASMRRTGRHRDQSRRRMKAFVSAAWRANSAASLYFARDCGSRPAANRASPSFRVALSKSLRRSGPSGRCSAMARAF